MNKALEYIQDLPSVISDVSTLNVSEDDLSYFQKLDNLIQLLKRNALTSIGYTLSLFADPKYHEFNDWEKFYQKF